MLYTERNMILTDLETTGLDPKTSEVIEIGALKVNPITLEVLDEFVTPVIFDAANADPEALLVNGYASRSHEWKNAMFRFEAFHKYFEFSREGYFASWGLLFDWSFIEKELRFFKIPDLSRNHRGVFERHFVDLPSVVWGILGPQPSMSLSNIAEGLGLSREPDPHTALGGAKHALEVLRAARRIWTP